MLTLLIIGAVALLFISAAMAPLESLSWWAGWYGTRDALDEEELKTQVQDASVPVSEAEHFLVYLSGIGAISGTSVPSEEIAFLDKLESYLPGTMLVRDVFPYSVTNRGLNGQRAFAWLWRGLEKQRLQRKAATLAFTILVRNMFQVAVSADPRYGPIFNLGVAQEIVQGLVRHGYPLGSNVPVTLLGWSGGGQISIGAANYLYGMLGAPIRVVSLGGVLSDDPGLLSLVHLYHLYGEKDPVQSLGAVLYAGRWPGAVQSPWNRAKEAGRITLRSIGPMTHNGKRNYFDAEAYLPDGQNHVDKTVDSVVDVLVEAGVARRTVTTADMSASMEGTR